MAGKLTDVAIRGVKPGEKRRKLFDGDNLFLHVEPNGSRLWRLRYERKKVDGSKTETLLAIGRYPQVGLKAAREAAAKARAQIKAGIDPVLQPKIEAARVRAEQATTFEVVARQWLERQAKEVTPAHLLDCTQRLKKHVFPKIGALPVTEIDAATVAKLVQEIEATGNEKRGFATIAHMAGRCLTMVNQVFRFAISKGMLLHNPARDVGDILVKPRVTHQPAVTTLPELVQVLRDVDATAAAPTTKLATRLIALTALRTIELRGGRWEEVDFEAATWVVPAERMKKGATHVVPLSAQAVALLRELHGITGGGALMFPGKGAKHPTMSEATINAALKRAGWEGRHTGHGFRAAFSTILNEAGHKADVIEFALAHVQGDKVRAAYNRSEYLAARRTLMQAWADLVEGAENGTNVVPIKAA